MIVGLALAVACAVATSLAFPVSSTEARLISSAPSGSRSAGLWRSARGCFTWARSRWRHCRSCRPSSRAG